MDYPDLSGDQFKRLINLVKLVAGFVIGAIALVASIAIFFSYKSISDIKEEVRNETNLIRSEVDNLMSYSKSEIDRVNKFSEGQIKYIKEDVVYQAKKSAEKKVENYFDNDSEVKLIIQNTAQNVLSKFEDEVNELTLQLPEILVAIERISNDNRDGIETIINLKENTENYIVKKMAEDLFNEKKNDYAASAKATVDTFFLSPISEKEDIDGDGAYFESAPVREPELPFLLQVEPDKKKWFDTKEENNIVLKLINTIRSDNDLDNVAIATYALIRMKGVQLNLFDWTDFEKKAKTMEDGMKRNSY